MLAKLRPRSVYDVMAAVALFIALATGSAYALDGSNTVFSDDLVNTEVKEADIGNAAVHEDELAQGAVRSDELANDQVKVADLDNGAVNSAKLADGQVLTADIGTEQVRSGDVANDNLTGADIAPDSLKGGDIDEGTLGFGGSQLIVRNGDTFSVPPGEDPFLTSECEPGERATGGGIKFFSPEDTDRVIHVAPTDGFGNVATDLSTPKGWGGRIFNGSTEARDARAIAICTDAS